MGAGQNYQVDIKGGNITLPTRQEWLNSLFSDYQISVSSSPKLVSDVQKMQTKRRNKLLQDHKTPPDMKRVTTVAMFQLEYPVNIKPIELLLSIGLITSPPVSNLVDICSTWAVIRYVWAFQPQRNTFSTPHLKLSDEARKIDFHQKALLSDEIGVGFANFLMINYFNAINPVDVSYIIDHSLSYNVYAKGKARPDYIFFDEVSGAKYVVECKGTQTSRAESIHQLQRGTEQVWSIQPTDGKPLTRIIIATCMLKNRTMTYIVDPPANEKDGNSYNDKDFDKQNDIRLWRPKGSDFRRNIRLISRAKMLTYAGFNNEAYKILPDFVRDRLKLIPSRVGHIETVETNLGNYDGTTITINYPDGTRLEIFRGILSHLRETFTKTNYDDSNWLTRESDPSGFYKHYNDQINASDEKRVLSTFLENDSGIHVRSLSRDGAMLEIRVSDLPI